MTLVQFNEADKSNSLKSINVSVHSPNKKKMTEFRSDQNKMRQLMQLWYLSHRRPVKEQASLHICAVSPEPSLFAYMKYGSRRRVRPKITHLAPLDGCACVFEKLVYGGREVP